jgi:hypothetical protein
MWQAGRAVDIGEFGRIGSTTMAEKRRSNVLVKLLAAIVVLAGLGYLFIRSLETTHAEPYEVSRAHLKWSLTLDTAGGRNAPLLSLRTSTELVAGLFRQLFQRAMESMNTPPHSSVPVVLRGEFERALAPKLTPDALLAAAREAGLESGRHEPRCLAHRRISEPGNTRQAYFAIVDSPSIVAFREKLAGEGQGQFDAAALTPILFVGATGPDFSQWLPLRADDTACVSPIAIVE